MSNFIRQNEVNIANERFLEILCEMDKLRFIIINYQSLIILKSPKLP